MIENSTSHGARAAIDAYLDAVEQAMLTAHAPRGDRTQVLEDLESQIADMLAQQPEPHTAEAVRAVIENLEPPSHFATMYGNGKAGRMVFPVVAPRFAGIRWTQVGAAALGLFAVGVVFVLFCLLAEPRVPGILVVWVAGGLVATPCALAMAYRQLRWRGEHLADRDLLRKCTVGYAVIAPALLMILLAVASDGAALIPFGIVGFIYFQFAILQWLRRILATVLLADDGSPSPGGAEKRREAAGSAETMGSAMGAV